VGRAPLLEAVDGPESIKVRFCAGPELFVRDPETPAEERDLAVGYLPERPR
jgi:hypothetical protein